MTKRRTTKEARARRVYSAWLDIEEAEPDISTERLMAMVSDRTGEDYGSLVDLFDYGQRLSALGMGVGGQRVSQR